MTDINQAGLEAAQLAIAKCTAVGRTTLEDHAYEAVTAYLEATKGEEDTPQATDDDLVERLRNYGEHLHELYGPFLEAATRIEEDAKRIAELEKREGKWALHPASQVAVDAYEAGQADAEKYCDRIEQLEADVERHINTAAELRLALDSVLEYYVSMMNSGDCGNWNPEGGE